MDFLTVDVDVDEGGGMNSTSLCCVSLVVSSVLFVDVVDLSSVFSFPFPFSWSSKDNDEFLSAVAVDSSMEFEFECELDVSSFEANLRKGGRR